MTHLKIKYDPNLKLDNELPWSILKYGLCSYFALAYAKAFPAQKPLLVITEYDRELELEYLVHVLVQTDAGTFIDAENEYNSWRESVAEMTDIEFMELGTKEQSTEQIRALIEHDIGYDPDTAHTINEFVRENYTKERKTP